MADKIIQFVNYYQPQLGYQEYHFAKVFAEMGYESHVVTSNYYFPYPQYDKNFQTLLGGRNLRPGKYTESGITIWRLPTVELISGSQVWLRNLSQTLKLIKPACVVCHNPYLLISYQIALMKQKIGFKLIFDTHAAAFNTKLTDTLIKQLYLAWFTKFAVAKITSAADGFFAIGESERELLESTFGLPKKSIPIIRLGVDTDLFKFSKQQRESIRSKFNIKPNDLLLIYAGKLSPNKEILTLIDALNLLPSKFKLLILGSGEKEFTERIKQKNKSGPRLLLHEMVANNELPGFFSAADIGIWPGDPSLSMLEALVTGLPLVVAQIQETIYLKKQQTVYFHQRGDSENLAKIVINIAKCDEKSRKKWQMELKNEFSWENRAKKVLNLLKSK